MFAALGNRHRRKILDLLRDGPRTTGDLAARFPGLSRYAVMQHLGVLSRARLVLYRHAGRTRTNYLNPVPLQDAYERWMRPLAQAVGAEVLALERHLSGQEEADMSDTPYRVIRVEAETRINRTPSAVFEALTTGLDAWWPHRSRDKARIVYEPRVGGRLYEDWGDGSGMSYGQVIHYEPPLKQVAVFTGGFGALMYTSRNTDVIEPDGDGAIYRKSLVMAGEISEELEARFRGGVGSVCKALKEHLEREATR